MLVSKAVQIGEENEHRSKRSGRHSRRKAIRELAALEVPVGTVVTHCPSAPDPYVRHYRIRLLSDVVPASRASGCGCASRHGGRYCEAAFELDSADKGNFCPWLA